MSKKNKFYTLDDLYAFCRNNKFEKFSSATMGAPLVVQTYGTFESTDNTSEGLMPVKLKSCHTGKNLNKSSITDDVMNACKASFCGRPILGAIYKTDTGEYEFRGHDMEIDEEGNIEYIEQPIGVISQTEVPYLEYDKDENKNYLMVSGTVFAEYSHAAEILQRRGSCACSVELAIDELSYDTKEDCLSIDAFRFMGVTVLGTLQDGETMVRPGMAGSNITIGDFSKENNSMFAINNQDKLVEVLDKLSNTLAKFTLIDKKGGKIEMDKLNELLAKYGKVEADITFETDGLTDEQLEAKFEELFGDADDVENKDEGDDTTTTEGETKGECANSADPEPESTDPVSGDTGDSEEPDDVEGGVGDMGCKKKKKCSIDENGDMTVSFEISHNDIRVALNTLLQQFEDLDNEWYWITDVYDDHFVYENWSSSIYYGQKYCVKDDVVAFDGDRYRLYKEMLTEAEKLSLEDMRSNYFALVEFKSTTEANELQAQKDAIFAKSEYASVKETKSFKKLIENSKDLSVEECELKANEIAEDFKSYAVNFTAEDGKKSNVIAFNFNAPEKKTKKVYGNLFAEK